MLISKIIKRIDWFPSVFKYSYKNERGYRKGLRRKPISVITENKNEDAKQIFKRDIMESLKQEQEIKLKTKTIIESNKPNVPPYVRLGENSNPFIQAMTLLKSRKKREKSNKILLEGKRLINDAITAGAELETIFFSREEDLQEILFKKVPNAKIMKVIYKQLSLWSDLTTCPGLMGIFKTPDYEKLILLNNKTIPLTVICDNVRDPGNLGSILRCGAAIGCQKILLMKGCVDVWEPKVLRSGCGAHFRIPVINNISWSIIDTYISKSACVFLADNQIINENHDKNVLESFNHSENEKYIEVNEGKILTVDDSYENEKSLKHFKNLHLPQFTYTGVTYENECILFIGGETEGLSLQAKKFGIEYNGCRITIPVENNVESLNSAISMAVIGFEIKRQFSLRTNFNEMPSK